MFAVGEDGVSLFGNPHPLEFERQAGKVGYFDAGDVVEISGIIAVAADAVGDLPDPIRDISDRLVEALPMSRDRGAALPGVALAETGDQ